MLARWDTGYGSIDGDKEIEGAMDVSSLALFEVDRRLMPSRHALR